MTNTNDPNFNIEHAINRLSEFTEFDEDELKGHAELYAAKAMVTEGMSLRNMYGPHKDFYNFVRALRINQVYSLIADEFKYGTHNGNIDPKIMSVILFDKSNTGIDCLLSELHDRKGPYFYRELYSNYVKNGRKKEKFPLVDLNE